MREPKNFVDYINEMTEEDLVNIISAAETEVGDCSAQFPPTCTEVAATMKRLAEDSDRHPYDCKCILHR